MRGSVPPKDLSEVGRFVDVGVGVKLWFYLVVSLASNIRGLFGNYVDTANISANT